MAHVQPGHQRRPRRRAHRGAAVRLRIACAFAGHAVEVRRLDQLLAIAADVALGEIVAEDEDQIGLGGRGGHSDAGHHAHSEKTQCGSHGVWTILFEGCGFQRL